MIFGERRLFRLAVMQSQPTRHIEPDSVGSLTRLAACRAPYR